MSGQSSSPKILVRIIAAFDYRTERSQEPVISTFGSYDILNGLQLSVDGRLAEKQRSPEIPKGQRFAGRPTLEKLFGQKSPTKRTRDQSIAKAVNEYGYSQMEVAGVLKLHTTLRSAEYWRP